MRHRHFFAPRGAKIAGREYTLPAFFFYFA